MKAATIHHPTPVPGEVPPVQDPDPFPLPPVQDPATPAPPLRDPADPPPVQDPEPR